MGSRGQRSYSSGKRPRTRGQYTGYGSGSGSSGSGRPVSSEKRRRRRRNRVIKAVIAWAVCVFLIGAIAVGTFQLVAYMTTSKKRQYRAEGMEKLAAGDYAGAIGSFDTALEKSGKRAEDFNRDVLLYRADAEFLLKDYNAALHTYDLLLETDPNRPEYMYRQSSCYAQMGDTEQAVKRYQEAWAADKKDKPAVGRQEALLAAGSACVDAKEYDRAMALYEDAIKDGMEHGEIYNQMGLCQMAAEDYQSAFDLFDKGYQVTNAARNAGMSGDEARKTGDKDKEEKDEKDEKDDKKADGELLKELAYNRAVACEHLQQYEKALGLFQDFVKEFGPNEDAEHEIAFLKTR